MGRFYEVGLELVRKTIDLHYDPLDLKTIEVWHNGQKLGLARPLVISEYNEVSSSKSKDIQKEPSTQGSRLFSVLEENAKNRLKDKMGVIP